ncbi:hypothetical protein CKA32_006982 [Geitlerinema sp. FC II]|nr:hypothetical protein CKA32_006982 [Geitlerinema sp. FC II]
MFQSPVKTVTSHQSPVTSEDREQGTAGIGNRQQLVGCVTRPENVVEVS